MSKYFSEKYNKLTPYTPGEQPQGKKFIKLNTNESPFPPSKLAIENASKEAERLMLYSDPKSDLLHEKLAEILKVSKNEVLATNGSDEILNFAFMAFCDEKHPAIFPDITYGFYPVFADLNNVPYEVIPLREDFTIDVEKFMHVNGTIFIANPNAPTGIALPLSTIEEIIKSNKNNVVVVDEAYVDFGAESAVSLIHKYDNLLVTQTFSKSRSMAGARLGFGVACESLINDLNTIKYSTNPYNVNRMTGAAGIGALSDEEYTWKNIKTIMKTRENTKKELEKLGFFVLPSCSNFLFAKSHMIPGEELYLKLKDRGILIRHFTLERIKEFNRITIGTEEQMKILVENIREILEEKK